MHAGIAFLPLLISGLFSSESVTFSISGFDLQTKNVNITDIFFKSVDQCLETQPIMIKIKILTFFFTVEVQYNRWKAYNEHKDPY